MHPPFCRINFYCWLVDFVGEFLLFMDVWFVILVGEEKYLKFIHTLMKRIMNILTYV